MSDTNSADELARLRAELYYLEKCGGMEQSVRVVRGRIAQLEAEADPWRRAKCILDEWAQGVSTSSPEWKVVQFCAHLQADNAAKAKRIAELEARPIPPLRADKLPVGAQMRLGNRWYTCRGKGGQTIVFDISPLGYAFNFYVEELQELIDRGVEFRLPEGGGK